ncbi:hypothetical protein B5G37_12545 [Pseudoflavonifractor sp. An85]|nr:hypothetical protein B5G37_12545 [Pseudoflavonifractor sp. An85]
MGMNYELLVESWCELGLGLLHSGAEIYRVEDTLHRLARAYHLQCEVFAIPNCLIVSVTDPEGRVHTRMRQATVSGTDIEGIERFNALSRKLCADPPQDPQQVLWEVRETAANIRRYPARYQLVGYFVGSVFFSLFFSGGWMEALVAGVSGLLCGLCMLLLSRTRSNFFINTMVSGFVLALVVYLALGLGLPINPGTAVVGSIMVLVPGLVFTNFMSNLLTGDIVSGLSTFTRAVLTAGAIALGTGAAISLCHQLFPSAVGLTTIPVYSPPEYCFYAFMGCLGFCLLYNVRGTGSFLCCLGGALGWAVYLPVMWWTGNVFLSNLAASVGVAIYAEIMARLRKCPSISYLVVSYFPLVPGFTVYQAVDYAIRGESQLFLETLIRTFGISGCIALGTLLVSTAVRMYCSRKEVLRP